MASGNARMGSGVGAATSNMVTATRRGMLGDDVGGARSQGETPGAGSIYAAELNERPNISNSRNQGPERAPSRMGSSTIPVQAMSGRNTGRKS